jgi:hypothetical protein
MTTRHRALTLAQTLLPCDKIVAAAGPLSPEGLDQDQANVINISYPLPWLERYLNNRYIGIDPVALTWMRSQQTTVWNHTITKQNMVIEQEFMEEARGYGVANGIIGGTIDPRSGRISFVAFAGGADKDNLRYKDVADYISSCLHDALTKNLPVPCQRAHWNGAAKTSRDRSSHVDRRGKNDLGNRQDLGHHRTNGSISCGGDLQKAQHDNSRPSDRQSAQRRAASLPPRHGLNGVRVGLHSEASPPPTVATTACYVMPRTNANFSKSAFVESC